MRWGGITHLADGLAGEMSPVGVRGRELDPLRVVFLADEIVDPVLPGVDVGVRLGILEGVVSSVNKKMTLVLIQSSNNRVIVVI